MPQPMFNLKTSTTAILTDDSYIHRNLASTATIYIDNLPSVLFYQSGAWPSRFRRLLGRGMTCGVLVSLIRCWVTLATAHTCCTL
jgi:hypothetical protein